VCNELSVLKCCICIGSGIVIDNKVWHLKNYDFYLTELYLNFTNSNCPLFVAGNMRHLIVESCISRNLLDTLMSEYVWSVIDFCFLSCSNMIGLLVLSTNQ
jgi:hypothetical protein